MPRAGGLEPRPRGGTLWMKGVVAAEALRPEPAWRWMRGADCGLHRPLSRWRAIGRDQRRDMCWVLWSHVSG